MHRTIIGPALLTIAMLSVAACTGASKGTEVTRFHLDQPIPPQTVGVRDSGEDSIEFGTYENIVAAELERIGFPVSDAGDTDLFVDISFFRGMETKAPSRSPVSVGIGGGSFGGNIGLGGGVSMPVGGGPSEVYVTRLEIKFVDRAENAIIWEGRAAKEGSSAPADPQATMRQVAAALLRDFPGESGKTIVVKDAAAAN